MIGKADDLVIIVNQLHSLQLNTLDHPDGAADRGRAVREGGGGQLRADRGRGGRLHAGNHRGRQIHSPTGFEQHTEA